MRKWKLKLVFLFTLLGAVGVFTIIPYELTTMSNQSVPGSLPPALVVTVNSIVNIILLFVMVLIGIRLQKRTGLSAPHIRESSL